VQVQKVMAEASAVGASLVACVVVVVRGVDKLWAATVLAAFEEHEVTAKFEEQDVMVMAAC